MLSFFRRYQRLFFIIIIVGLVASFGFLGLSGEREAPKEVVLYKAINGSSVTQERVDQLVRFLSSSHFDFLDDQIAAPNWLNEGVIENLFLETSWGGLVAERVLSSIKKDLSSAVLSACSFVPYRHPNHPLLTAEAIWTQFLPETASFKGELFHVYGHTSLKAFELLTQIYLKQKSFPAIFCKKMLMMQESKEKESRPDEKIPYMDVSLFGLHSLTDFFGSSYLRSAAEVIINASAYAQQMGIRVSLDEAREQLYLNLKAAASLVGREFSPEQLQGIFLQQAHGMGLEEHECLSLYKDILLCKKWIASGEQTLLLDPLLLQEFQDFAKEEALIELFSWPSSLQMRDFYSVLKLQTYIEAVSSPKMRTHPLSLPKQFFSVSEVYKKAPELVHTDCILEYGQIDLQKESAHIGLKEVWSWETGAGWELVKKQFAYFKDMKTDSKEERFAALALLESKERHELDLFSRKKMLVQDLCKIKSSLANQNIKKETCSFSDKGEGLSFKEIKDKEALSVLIATAALKTEESPSSPALAAREKLLFYTEDEEHYYAIQVVQRSEEKRILTFAEAGKTGVLKKLVDQKLEESYPEVRKGDPVTYRQKDGSWLPLVQVKDLVGLAISRDLCRAIQTEYRKIFMQELTAEQLTSPAFYAKQRMLLPMEEALDVEKKGESSLQLSSSAQQWALVKETKAVLKGNRDIFSKEELFYLEPGSFSPQDKGRFFRLLERKKPAEISLDDAGSLRKVMQQELEREMISYLLDQLQSKGILGQKT